MSGTITTGKGSPLGYEDSFGKLIADGTVSKLDIASHYPYNPERWKIFVDGTRVFPEYGSVSQYNHTGSVHELIPAAGETVVLETAERPSYVVHYDQSASFAAGINQDIQSGDIIQFGPFDDDDGWFLEVNDTHGVDECDMVIRSGGTDQRTKKGKLSKAITDFTRFAVNYGWYRVSPSHWTQYYVESDMTRLNDVGRIGMDDARSNPEVGNLPLRYSVTAGPSTSGLKLEAGSVSVLTLGGDRGLNRVKGADFTDDIDSIDTWVPIRAFRLAPDKDIVNVQLLDLSALSYSQDVTVRIQAQVFEEENVSFADTDSWGVPGEWLAQNNAIQTRDDVSAIPDNDGTTAATKTNPGGFQIGRSILLPSADDFKKGSTEGGDVQQKRDVPQGIFLVVLGKASSVGDVTYEISFEQDW